MDAYVSALCYLCVVFSLFKVMRSCYTVMKTDFARCKTSVFSHLPIHRYASSQHAWDAAMLIIRTENGKSDGSSFFWLKYK